MFLLLDIYATSLELGFSFFHAAYSNLGQLVLLFGVRAGQTKGFSLAGCGPAELHVVCPVLLRLSAEHKLGQP
jgi:hypothetical protein